MSPSCCTRFCSRREESKPPINFKKPFHSIVLCQGTSSDVPQRVNVDLGFSLGVLGPALKRMIGIELFPER